MESDLLHLKFRSGTFLRREDGVARLAHHQRIVLGLRRNPLLKAMIYGCSRWHSLARDFPSQPEKFTNFLR